MIRNRLKPKNDFIFQRLFGEVETKDTLISLLNAILRLPPQQQLADLTVIENKALIKEFIDDKTGRLDIRAKTLDGVQINIEMQMTNEHNMDRRTLFYFGKLFLESIKSGDKFQDLKRTITINLLNFNFLPIESFHSTFHLYEDHERDYKLTDLIELHFIEFPKFRAIQHDLLDPLHRWLLYMEENLSENLLEELISMDPVIKKTEERLEWLSSDAETLRRYDMRENSRIELNSIMYELTIAQEKGEREGKLAVAKELLLTGMSPEAISSVTKLSLQDVQNLVDER